MAGFAVTRQDLDTKSAEAVLALRSAFDRVESINAWISNNPVVDGVDPLETVYGYSEDESYIIRIFFETMNTVRVDFEGTFEIGRKLTGLH